MKKVELLPEKELISFLKKGSVAAFESIFGTYSQKLYRFSLSYLKSEAEAEDIVQEVFLTIWKNRTTLKTDTSFQSYLFTIAFHAIQKSFIKKSRQQKFQIEVLDQLAAESPSLEEHQQFEILVSKLNHLIELMPERRREIFLKRKKVGKSIHQIATEMEISEKTVENQITEAMNFLRKSFMTDKMNGNLFFLLFLA